MEEQFGKLHYTVLPLDVSRKQTQVLYRKMWNKNDSTVLPLKWPRKHHCKLWVDHYKHFYLNDLTLVDFPDHAFCCLCLKMKIIHDTKSYALTFNCSVLYWVSNVSTQVFCSEEAAQLWTLISADALLKDEYCDLSQALQDLERIWEFLVCLFSFSSVQLHLYLCRRETRWPPHLTMSWSLAILLGIQFGISYW